MVASGRETHHACTSISEEHAKKKKLNLTKLYVLVKSFHVPERKLHRPYMHQYLAADQCDHCWYSILLFPLLVQSQDPIVKLQAVTAILTWTNVD